MNEPESLKTYFLTPELSQRLDLIRHLLANTTLTGFVQAAEGAGKTRLARHLADILSDSYSVCLVSGGPLAGISDLRQVLAESTGLSTDIECTDEMLEEQFSLLAEQKKPVLVILDDADQLAADSLSWITRFFCTNPSTCKTRFIVFSAVDVLALPLGPVALASLKDNIQVLDIPPFTEEQTRAFVEFTRAEDQAAITDAQISHLYQESHGVPGQVLWQIQFASFIKNELNEGAGKKESWMMPLIVVAAIAFAGVAIGLLYFQDEVNQLFAGAETKAGDSDTELQTLVIPKAQQPVELMTGPPVLDKASKATVLVKPELKKPDFDQDLVESLPETFELVNNEAEIAEAEKQAEIENRKAAVEAKVAEVMQEVMQEPVKPLKKKPPVQAAIKAGTNNQQKKAEKNREPAVSKPQRAATVKPAPAVKSKPVTAISRKTGDFLAPDWIVSKGDGYYSLQLVGVRDKKAIGRFVDKHGLKGELIVLETRVKGRPWFSLLYGAYADKKLARAAIRQLPDSLRKKDIWIRSVSSIRTAVQQK